uniref:Uncharacterized protein n=1 Tax=Anguilla anguilla TaxID=7936 RepID=A0A0E9UC67_ANGAN
MGGKHCLQSRELQSS